MARGVSPGDRGGGELLFPPLFPEGPLDPVVDLDLGGGRAHVEHCYFARLLVGFHDGADPTLLFVVPILHPHGADLAHRASPVLTR